jgi:hypothetical protein
MIIVPRNVKENTSSFLLEKALEFCKAENALEIFNVADLGSNEYRIMYYIGENQDTRKIKVIILNIPSS